MVGSRQGWVEAPYVECPAGLSDAAARLVRVTFGAEHRLHIVPGLRCVGDDGQADVMRGEETQLWGADLPAGSCCVLPGTHSKWAWLGEGDRVLGFQTHMTGEVYALLTQHGILGRLMEFGAPFAPACVRRRRASGPAAACPLAAHAVRCPHRRADGAACARCVARFLVGDADRRRDRECAQRRSLTALGPARSRCWATARCAIVMRGRSGWPASRCKSRRARPPRGANGVWRWLPD